MAASRPGVPGGAHVTYANAGAPGPGEAQQFGDWEKSVTAQPWQTVPRSGAAIGDAVNLNTFPARYYTANPMDEYVELKNLAMRSMYRGPNNEQGRVHTMLTDRDLAYVDDKRKQAEYARFLSWTEQWFNFGDPAQADLYAKAFPDYYEKRKDLILNIAQIQTRYAILRLLGPRTKEDFLFLWGIQTGRIPLITGPIWNPADWRGAGPPKRYAMFSIWRPTEYGPRLPNAANRTDPLGAGYYHGHDNDGVLNVGIANQGVYDQIMWGQPGGQNIPEAANDPNYAGVMAQAGNQIFGGDNRVGGDVLGLRIPGLDAGWANPQPQVVQPGAGGQPGN